MASRKKGSAKRAKGAEETRIAFVYQKSPGFRSIHADGAYGGLTPRGEISFAFYAESQSPPELELFPVDADGQLGQRIDDASIQPASVDREFQCRVFMNLEAAKRFHAWLGEKLRLAKKLAESSK